MKEIQRFLGIGFFSTMMIISGFAQNDWRGTNAPVLGSFPKIGIVEAASNFSTLEGVIYLDQDKDCEYQTTEETLEGVTVRATSLTTGETYTAQTTENGTYIIAVQPDKYTISSELPSPYYKLSCQNESTIEITNLGETKSIDLGMKATVNCAFLNVEIAATIIHKTDASTYTIAYCNHGTIEAKDAYIQLTLDDYLDVEHSTHPTMTKQGNDYIFELGTVAKGACNDFELVIKVREEAILGQTHCTNVAIYPDNICDPAVKGIKEQTSAAVTSPVDAHVLGNGRDYVFEDHVILRSEDRATLMTDGPALLSNGDGTGDGDGTETNQNIIVNNTNTNANTNANSILTTNNPTSNLSGWTTEQINLFYTNLDQNFPSELRFLDQNCQANTPFHNNIEINNNPNNNGTGQTSNTPNNSGGDDNQNSTTNTNNSVTTEESNEDSAIKKIFEYENSEEIEVQVDVMPNPFLEKATITIKGGAYQQLTLKLMNIAGQELRLLPVINNQVQLYREDLARGMYIYRIEENGAIIHSGKLLIR